MEVRQLGPEEGMLYREVRLFALRDTPDAFGDTLAEALLRPEQWWRDRAHEIADNSGREVLLIACDQAKSCGLLYVRLETIAAHFYGMCVEPGVRRRAPGAALLNAGLSWAKKKVQNVQSCG
jgi:GNAT superfamily N-acetyltransferase